MFVCGEEIDKVLIVRKPYAHYIIDGIKTWEMRGKKTKIRGRIGIAEQGAGKIICLTTISDCLEPIPDSEIDQHFSKHRVDYKNNPDLLKWNTPWVLSDTKPIKPVDYVHKRGAVIFVNV